MSLQEKSSLVAKIELKTNTYYVTDRRGGVLLDGNTYENVVTQWGDVAHIGNLGNGQAEVGSVEIIINNGEEYSGNGYRFDPTDVWNNAKMTIRRYVDGTHFRFDDCIPHAKGIIKEYKIGNGQNSFTLEETDRRDDQLLPSILCTDQGGLSDSEYKTTFKYWGQANYVEPTNINIFSIGELVKLINPNGTTEYARVKSKENIGGLDLLFFYSDTNNAPWAFDFTNTIEKAFKYLPKIFVDKTIPLQYGDLSNTGNGIFAKCVTVNERIGQEAILADYLTINEFNNLGAWENGLKKYFQAQAINATIKGDQAEYEIDGNTAKFLVDSTTTLSADIVDTSEGISVIQVSDYTKIMYVNEGDLGTSANQDLISTNILAINDELMVIMGKPTSSQVYVERGFNNTPIGTHQAGDKVYQSAKYSSRNLLIFTERFMPKMVTNATARKIATAGGTSEFDSDGDPLSHFTQVYKINATTGQGKLSNIKDESILNYANTYITIVVGNVPSSDVTSYDMLFDVVFPKIEDEFGTIGWYPATKYKISITLNQNMAGGTGSGTVLRFAVINPNVASEADGFNVTIANEFDFASLGSITAGLSTSEKDYYTLLDRTLDGNYGSLTVGQTSLNAANGSNFTLTNLTDLNKKWKIRIRNTMAAAAADDNAAANYETLIYNVGFWIDFFIDFTEKVVMGNIKGREYDFNVVDIVGNASPDSIGDLIENPVDVVAHLLALELGYSTRGASGLLETEFTSNWQAVHNYYEDSNNFEVTSPASPTPECAMSYGIEDERKRGWEFVSWVASHFNLQVIKTYDGKLDIINLHKIYNDTPSGNEIKIEDILFLAGSGDKRITIHQTGTDLIYNDIVVKYKRNNSTGNYQEDYILPDSYTLVKSGATLATVRDDYYGGEKRNLTIESPFIYNEQDARRLAEWKADDQAEVHFFVDFFIDYMHYSDKNSLSEQYRMGDVVYLTGKHAGITFTSSRKFYVQNIIFTDSGREVQIQAKSVDPVTLF